MVRILRGDPLTVRKRTLPLFPATHRPTRRGSNRAKTLSKIPCHFDPFDKAQDKLREKSFLDPSHSLGMTGLGPSPLRLCVPSTSLRACLARKIFLRVLRVLRGELSIPRSSDFFLLRQDLFGDFIEFAAVAHLGVAPVGFGPLAPGNAVPGIARLKRRQL